MVRPVLQFNLSLIYKGHIKQTEEVAYLINGIFSFYVLLTDYILTYEVTKHKIL